MFKERTNPTTTVTVAKEFAPRVGIESEALVKMQIYVEQCADEIGWLGTAYRNYEMNTIVIKDVFLFDQEVHATTTEITPEGLSSFAEELLEQGDAGIEIWNNMKVWGHSHVNMGVSPSAQDNSQMVTFREGGQDWFIRIIANKKGEMKIDLYDYQLGLILTDLPWVEVKSEEENAILEQIDKLYALLDVQNDQRVTLYEEVIKEEMKVKVRKLTYASRVTHSANGYWQGGVFHPYPSTQTKLDLKDEKKKTEAEQAEKTMSTTHGNDTDIMEVDGTTDFVDRAGFYGGIDVFTTDDDVTDHFTNIELMDLNECRDFAELEEELTLYGYYNYFTMNDVERIFRVMRKSPYQTYRN